MFQGNKHALYAIYNSKDARFDGRFFVAILSTKIYCRPVCKAKQAKEKSCTFYSTAAEAEQAGYRPCLLCRPELAPASAINDDSASLAFRAAKKIEENYGNSQNLTYLAKQLGCTDRHLRRVFKAEYNVSPVQYLQTSRLLLAKNLLTESKLAIVDVAMASGFGSLRRFNDLFKNRYQLSPSALRKKGTEEKYKGSISLSLGYRPPYRWEEILNFFAGRAIPGVELIKDNEYLRTVHLVDGQQKDIFGSLRVAHKPRNNTLNITVSESLLSVLPQVLAKVRQQFDLYCEPQAVYETLASMNKIRPDLAVLGVRLPGGFNAFELAVRAVLGQQISVKAARTLAARMVLAYGKAIQTGFEGLTHVFPTVDDVLALKGPIENHFGPLGIIASRSRSIYALAQALKDKKIDLGLWAKAEIEIKKLQEIPGIGKWTAHYIAMRAIHWPDAFLETDAGIKKALPYTAKELLQMAETWRPWRSYATINLWNSL